MNCFDLVWIRTRVPRRVDLRLSVLGARGLAARFAAASHFEVGFWVNEKLLESRCKVRDAANVGMVNVQRG